MYPIPVTDDRPSRQDDDATKDEVTQRQDLKDRLATEDLHPDEREELRDRIRETSHSITSQTPATARALILSRVVAATLGRLNRTDARIVQLENN